MPISSTDGCSAEHWSDVKAIITQAVESVGDPKFSVRLVSDADDIGVIQKRIVQNLYTADVVVCDVSGKNPNVMFELGMRLAFDKPTVIVKDDKTDYSFDTGIIEHVGYPRDLSFHRMVQHFKSVLAEKIFATFKAAKADPEHSTFLKNFGKFHVANLNQDVVPADKLVVEMLSDIQSELARLRAVVPRDLDGRRTRMRPSLANLARIRTAVDHYLAKIPTADRISLLDSAKFIDDIERDCDAQQHFASRSDFLEALKIVTNELMPRPHFAARESDPPSL